jgi:hypothetical protein
MSLQILPCWTTVGFTGHRRLDQSEATAAAIRTVVGELESAYRPLAVVSSAASGADTLFLEEVARRGLPYFLCLPFSKDRFRQDFSDDDWNLAAGHFDQALSVECACDDESAGEAYLDCGFRIVDRADVLLAIWNGQPAAGKGGTADIVEYARALGKPVVWIEPTGGAIHRERLDRLPAATSPQSVPTGSQRELVEEQFAAYDQAARRYAPAARWLILAVICLHLLASAAGTARHLVGAATAAAGPLSAFKLGALVISLFLILRQRSVRHEWMHARVAAEICRSFLSVWALRRQGARFPFFPAEEHKRLIGSLTMAWYLDKGAARPLEDARNEYATARVRDQFDYFARRYQFDGRRARALKAASTSITIVAIVLGVVNLVLPPSAAVGWAPIVLSLLATLLPLLPPALLSAVLTYDLARRADRFRDVSAALERAKERLKLVQTWPGLWREVVEIESLLLGEVEQWHSVARYSGK